MMQSAATFLKRASAVSRCRGNAAIFAGRTSTASLRFYRGEAQEGVPTLSAQEQALLKVAKPKSDAIFARHIQLPDLDRIPKASFDPSTTNPGSSSNVSEDDLALDVRRKRLIYRSKQRGWLEVDLLLGTWASENVMTLTNEELDEYEAFCNMETIDIYNIITLRVDVPEHLKKKSSSSLGLVEQIQDWARKSPLGKADPEKYKSTKASAKLI